MRIEDDEQLAMQAARSILFLLPKLKDCEPKALPFSWLRSECDSEESFESLLDQFADIDVARISPAVLTEQRMIVRMQARLIELAYNYVTVTELPEVAAGTYE